MTNYLLDTLVIGFIGFVGTFFLGPYNILFSKRVGLVSHPHKRGLHQQVTPLAGGLSFALPILFCLVGLYLFHPEFVKVLPLSAGGLITLILGLIDDRKNLSPGVKLCGQFLIALFMIFCGFRIDILTNPLGQEIVLGALSYPLTIFWYLLVMNAINLIDGSDGFAAGIAVIVFLVTFVAGIIFQKPVVALPAFAAAAACLAFLRYNFYPAKIFMGDTGSLFLGFLIASLAISGQGQVKGITAITLLIPISVLFVPLSDTFFAVVRRLKNRQGVFKADKEHLHHKLLALGFSQRTVAFLGYFTTFLFGLIALGFSLANKEAAFILFFLLAGLFVLIFLYFWKKGFLK